LCGCNWEYNARLRERLDVDGILCQKCSLRETLARSLSLASHADKPFPSRALPREAGIGKWYMLAGMHRLAGIASVKRLPTAARGGEGNQHVGVGIQPPRVYVFLRAAIRKKTGPFSCRMVTT
jgi:hypothetical protein